MKKNGDDRNGHARHPGIPSSARMGMGNIVFFVLALLPVFSMLIMDKRHRAPAPPHTQVWMRALLRVWERGTWW